MQVGVCSCSQLDKPKVVAPSGQNCRTLVLCTPTHAFQWRGLSRLLNGWIVTPFKWSVRNVDLGSASGYYHGHKHTGSSKCQQ